MVVPLAAPAAGVFLGEFLGQQIDGAHSSRPDPAEQLQLTGDLYQDTGGHLGSVADRYEEEADRHQVSITSHNVHDVVRNSYGHGKMTGGNYGG